MEPTDPQPAGKAPCRFLRELEKQIGRDLQLAGVIYNDEKTREAITKEQMKKFFKFVHDDNVYCKYYEVFYILFHTGTRISEFCGLTLKDVDMKNKVIDINH